VYCSVQYGQGPSLHALVGLVSLVGAEDGNLLYIKGGNDQLIAYVIHAFRFLSTYPRWNRALLEAATATVKLESPVRKVEKAGCRFMLDQYGEFDAGVCPYCSESKVLSRLSERSADCHTTGGLWALL
jgi:hypothetical protein